MQLPFAWFRTTILILPFVLGCSPCLAKIQNKHTGSSATTLKVLSPQQIFDKCKQSVVTVETQTSQGTGFKCLNDALITCNHVISGSHNITVRFAGRLPIALTRIHNINVACDYAIFSVADNNPSLDLAKSSEVKIGDPIYVIGSPKGLEQTFTQGILSGRRLQDGVEYLQLSAAVSPGSSGSPVLNKYGQVIGMVTSTLQDGQALNFALSTESFLKFYATGIPVNLLVTSTSPDTGQKPTAPLSFVSNNDPEIFRNLSSLYLLVEDIRPEIEAHGLTTARIFQSARIKLMAAGITLQSDKEHAKALGKPILYINISTSKILNEVTGMVGFSVTISLDEEVALLRKSGTSTIAKVWSSGFVGSIIPSKVDSLVGIMDDALDQFIELWQKANPKK